jgi:ParB family transcriptional regulator, chromosome partitioning protein
VSANVKPRLGRGLDALLSGPAETTAPATATVPVGQIQANPYQPRKEFDDDELLGLAESIKAHGILQPLVVRQVEGRYQLIAGERRLRAAQLAGLGAVPVNVVAFSDQQVLEAALVENIQRSDLNPVEKALGFRDYLDRFQMTQEQLAARLGLDRTTISNLIGVLLLPAEVQGWVRAGQLSLGHAKILKGLTDPEKQVALGKEAIAKTYSVHALDLVVKQHKAEAEVQAAAAAGVKTEPARKPAAEKTAHVQSIEDELRQKLATRVEVKLKAKDRGQIVLGFETNDDFERILDVLRR